MSNKIVPAIYRHIIDDVIGNMKTEFDEYGVSEDVLSLLQDKWETKVIASHVAEFEPTPPIPQPPQTAPYHQGPPQLHPSQIPPPVQYSLPPPHYIKSEPIDRPYVSLTSGPPPPHMQQYILPPINGHPQNGRPGQSQQSVLVLPRGAPPNPPSQSNASSTTKYTGGASGGRIPQLDGPSFSNTSAFSNAIPQLDGPSSSASSSDHASPPPTDAKKEIGATGNEEINSDLDDSDSDADDEEDPTATGGADVDIVFCTYDKVARVKNKWKTLFKDGMIHVNGKDYLFAKCNGEFEW